MEPSSPRNTPDRLSSPWMSLADAASYARRGKRFLAREVKAGRLRAARVGGRGELLLRAQWVDEWLEELARPVAEVGSRRSAGQWPGR
jgi:excisionase family DNA binding protein